MKRLIPSVTLAASLSVALLRAAPALAQTGSIGIGTTAPAPSALLDLTSSTRGLLAPRMLASERAAIQNPANGLLVFQTDGPQLGFWYYASSGGWTYVNPAGGAADNLGNHTATLPLRLNNQSLSNNGTGGLRIADDGKVGVGLSTPAAQLHVSGDLKVGAPATSADFLIQQSANNGFVNGPLGGQSFTIPAGGAVIKSIQLNNLRYAVQNEQLSIFQGDGYAGPLLFSQTVNSGTGAQNFTLTTPLPVAAGIYTFQFTGNQVPDADYNNPYAGGQAWSQLGAITGADFSFELAYTRLTPAAQALYAAGTQVGINTFSPQATLHVGGSGSTVRFDGLAGTGTRAVTTDGAGNLATQPTPALSLNGTTLSLGNGSAPVTLPSGADNLGNHTATQALNLGSNLLSGGGATGLVLDNSGNAVLGGTQGGGAPSAPFEIRRGGSPNAHMTFHNSGVSWFSFGQDVADGNKIKISDGNTLTGSNLFTLSRNGNLGLGTTNPSQRLDVVGNATVSGSVGVGTTTPHPSAALDVTTTTKGLLFPRLTQAQRNAIASPAAGLTIFNTDSQRLNYFDGGRWTEPLLNQTAEGLSKMARFDFTGAPQTWTVPAGMTTVTVDAYGAGGGSGSSNYGWGNGGQGGRVQTTLAVTPGEVLTIVVGGAGVAGYGNNAGGYNGGGLGHSVTGGYAPEGGGGGGGATDIRRGGTALSHRIVVAGGGSGGSANWNGRCGGGLEGCDPGSGGTQTGGGGSGASVGSLGQGGEAQSSLYNSCSGGGGGYYGGGGALNSYLGGGGSSYTSPATTSNVVHTQGVNGGNGYLIFSSPSSPDAPLLSLANATVPFAAGGVVYSDGSKLAANASQLRWDQAATSLGVGTASPQARLHVVGPGMAVAYGANVAGQAVVTASSTLPGNTNYQAPKLTDGLTGPTPNSWWATNQNLPQWGQLDFGSQPRVIKRYGVYVFYDPRTASRWTLQGSQNALAWTNLHSVTTDPALDQFTYYEVANTVAFRYYRLHITGVLGGNANNGALVSEWQVLEGTTSYTGPALQVNGAFQLGEGAPLTSAVSADGTFAANTDELLPTQKAVKTYVDAHGDNLGTHTATQALVLSNYELRLRTAADGNHALRYESAVDGVGLYGYMGGMLGYNQGSGAQPVLRWTNGGQVGIGTGATSPLARLHVAGGNVRLDGTNFFEFGGGISGKQADAGKIGYQTFSADALDIVGAAPVAGSRKIKLWAEGGTTLAGPLTVAPLSGSGTRMLTADANGTLGVQAIPAGADNLGNHTATQPLQMGGNAVQFGASTSAKITLYNSDYAIGVQGATQYFRSGDAFAWYTGGNHHDGQFNAGGGTAQLILKNGRLGINTTSAPTAPLEVQQRGASPYIYFHEPNIAHFSFGQDHADGNKIKLNTDAGFGSGNLLTITPGGDMGLGTTTPRARLDVNSGSVRLPGYGSTDTWFNYAANGHNYLRGTTILADEAGSSKVGIGTANPQAKLDVAGGGSIGAYNYAYLAYNGNAHTGATNYNGSDISIQATGRIVGSEFNARSDRRLKNVLGRSDAATDLALLTQLRITDYTMRDRAQYGDRRFKKVIAQEVEAVFPQAVSQQTGFLPDVYAPVVGSRAEGDSLVYLTLAAVPAGTATVGQRVKLVVGASATGTPAGEVIAVVARPGAGRELVVRSRAQLVEQEAFVFGLEHANVRTVDYEALAMLNLSATQALARQVAALEAKQLATQQQAACAIDAAAEAATRAATAEAALQTFEQRLRELEARLGTARQ